MDTFIIIIIIIVVIVIALLLAIYFKWPIDITGGESDFELNAINIIKNLTGHDFYPVKIALQELRLNTRTTDNAFDGTIGDAFDIDGYCAELNVAIEVQGPHHYRPVGDPHNYEVLRKTNRHDQMKRIWCESRGINLVTIPESVQKELNDRHIRTAYWHIASILYDAGVSMNYSYNKYKKIIEPIVWSFDHPEAQPPYYAVDFSQCPSRTVCARFDYNPTKGLYSLTGDPPKLDPKYGATSIHMFLRIPCSTNSAIVEVESQSKIFENSYHCRAIIESGIDAQWGEELPIEPMKIWHSSRFNPALANDFWRSIHRDQRNVGDPSSSLLQIPYLLLEPSITEPGIPDPIRNQPSSNSDQKITAVDSNKRTAPQPSTQQSNAPQSSAPAAKQFKPNFQATQPSAPPMKQVRFDPQPIKTT